MKKCTSAMVLFMALAFSFTGISQNIEQAINLEVNRLLEDNTVQSPNNSWVITNQNTSRISGIHNVYFRQTFNGIEIYGSESSIHFLPNGDVLKANTRFIENTADKATTQQASLSAADAVQRAASHFGYQITESLSVISGAKGLSQETILSEGGISLSPIPAELVYQINQNNELVLAWDLSIEETARQNWWSVRVDASSGAIVDQVNWMLSCSFEHDHSSHEHEEAINFHRNLFDIPNYDEIICNINADGASSATVDSYEVFAIPLESPYYGARTIEVTPANAIASPFGWHDTDGAAGAEFTTTRGNNVDAYDANTNYRPDGGATLEFTGYPFDPVYTAGNQYEDASMTNLFYLNNVIHDVAYIYGLDEAAGNFQENNYGNGGAGGDYVNANGQISVWCNATFGTPPDGSNPSMNMYICNDKDGNFDNLVVFHEYGHGVSNRFTGGPGNTGCLSNTEQMGEGWSDYLGVILTIEPGDTGTDARGVGTYLFGQGANGPGIRTHPYSTDFGVNDATYADITTESVPHGVGFVWATMLWELTWELVDAHGLDTNIYNFTGDVTQDAGNVQALAIIMEGMRLQPCSPGFVDGRDAILAADVAIYGGANECRIWDAFARRGLGVNADQGSSNSRSDGVENFETPSGLADLDTPYEFCESDAVQTGLGGGSPFGGVYSGPGVTDDGNGATFTFDPVAAGVGVHTITYDVSAGPCSTASSDTDTLEVVSGLESPTTTGVSDFCVGDPVTVTATPFDNNNMITWYDEATGGNVLGTGTSYTWTPGGADSVYAEETPPLPDSQLKISEITLQADKLEIQNVGLAADYTGYSVALSDTPYSDINSVNSVVQTLGAMGADSARFWDEVGGSGQDWGTNIFWNDGQPGWILIIDGSGNVVDSAFWNTGASEIASFNVTVNGFNITAADLDWVGDGAPFTNTCNDSYRRNNDSDDASNWDDGCQTSDYGTANGDINLTFQGCVGSRTEAAVTPDAEAPTIDCPANITVGNDPGECSATVSLGTPTTTDNCGGETTSNDAPSEFPVGTTTVTWTVTDLAGNTATCTQEVTVEDTEAPSLTCPADLTVDVNAGELFTLPDYTGDAVTSDNCTADPSLTQDPAAGTDIGPGVTTITITSEDDAGNTETCTFDVTVQELLGIEDNALGFELVLYPNPTNGVLTLVNKGSQEITDIVITDVNGRIVQIILPQVLGADVNFSIANLAQGMYFVRISTEDASTIKRIVKR